MNKHLLWAMTLLAGGLLASCHKKTAPAASAPPVTTSPTAAVAARPLEYRLLTSKAKLQFESQEQNLSSAASLRLLKDSTIWISVIPAVGIEAVRAKITPDSIKLLNRLEKTYLATDFGWLRRQFNIDVDFNALQELLVGNQPFPLDRSTRLVATEPDIQIRQEKGPLVIHNFIEKTNGKLRQIQVQDSLAKKSLGVSYTEFNALGNFVFPYAAMFRVQQTGAGGTKAAVLTISHNKVSVSEPSLTFPFEVPAGYKRIK